MQTVEQIITEAFNRHYQELRKELVGKFCNKKGSTLSSEDVEESIFKSINKIKIILINGQIINSIKSYWYTVAKNNILERIRELDKEILESSKPQYSETKLHTIFENGLGKEEPANEKHKDWGVATSTVAAMSSEGKLRIAKLAEFSEKEVLPMLRDAINWGIGSLNLKNSSILLMKGAEYLNTQDEDDKKANAIILEKVGMTDNNMINSFNYGTKEVLPTKVLKIMESLYKMDSENTKKLEIENIKTFFEKYANDICLPTQAIEDYLGTELYQYAKDFMNSSERWPVDIIKSGFFRVGHNHKIIDYRRSFDFAVANPDLSRKKLKTVINKLEVADSRRGDENVEKIILRYKDNMPIYIIATKIWEDRN
jgi:hypothetical protein